MDSVSSGGWPFDKKGHKNNLKIYGSDGWQRFVSEWIKKREEIFKRSRIK